MDVTFANGFSSTMYVQSATVVDEPSTDTDPTDPTDEPTTSDNVDDSASTVVLTGVTAAVVALAQL